MQVLAVLSQVDDAASERLDVDQVDRGDILAHRGLGRLDHFLGLALIARDLGDGRDELLGGGGLKEKEKF